MKKNKILFIATLSALLSACSGFFDKDNTPSPSPLLSYTPEARIQSLWHTNAGCGAAGNYLKLIPATNDQAIFTANHNGVMTATDKTTGKILWQANTGVNITGGPGAGSDVVVVGSREGDVVALNQMNGAILWKTKVSTEILAAPAIAHGVVLIKTIDGKLSALAVQDGHVLWNYIQTEPALILRGSSSPKISHDTVVAGFANGNLAKLTLRDGSLVWAQALAIPEGSFAIQRMIDIDADPVIFNNRIYAATYQGRITAMESTSGKPIWTHDISSYTGLAADRERVYVTDAKSHVWAFDNDSGTVSWKQPQLEYRNITGPAMMNNYIVVGDEEGYLHWLSKQDGHVVGRVRVNNSGIIATPLVINNTLYVVTKNGQLASYTLG